MLKFILKRTVSGIAALLLFTFVMFVLIEVLLPGDYATPFRLSMTGDEIADHGHQNGLGRDAESFADLLPAAGVDGLGDGGATSR